MRTIRQIVIHGSASRFGNALLIDRWHKEKGWPCIGYHYVICNGYPHPGGQYQPQGDGAVEHGRKLEDVGSHVKGHNQDTVGICLIGDSAPGAGKPPYTLPQLRALRGLVHWLAQELAAKGQPVTIQDVVGHCELDPAGKPHCPGLPMDTLRAYLAAETEHDADALLPGLIPSR